MGSQPTLPLVAPQHRQSGTLLDRECGGREREIAIEVGPGKLAGGAGHRKSTCHVSPGAIKRDSPRSPARLAEAPSASGPHVLEDHLVASWVAKHDAKARVVLELPHHAHILGLDGPPSDVRVELRHVLEFRVSPHPAPRVVDHDPLGVLGDANGLGWWRHERHLPAKLPTVCRVDARIEAPIDGDVVFGAGEAVEHEAGVAHEEEGRGPPVAAYVGYDVPPGRRDVVTPTLHRIPDEDSAA